MFAVSFAAISHDNNSTAFLPFIPISNLKSFFDKELSEHEAVLRATRNTLAEPFMELCDVAEKTLKKKPLPVFAQKSIHYEKPIISTAPEIIERKFRLKEFQKDELATQNKKVGKKKRNKTLKKKTYILMMKIYLM